MKSILKISYIIFLMILVFKNMNVYAENDAGTRASYTRGGWAGARYVAMGKAAEVVVDDVYSIYWNPAGLRELLQKGALTSEEIKGRAASGNIDSISEKDLVKFSEDEYPKTFVQIGVSSAVLDADREAGFAGIAFNVFKGVMGIGYYGIQSRNIESRDESGNYIKDINYTGSVGYLSYGWGTGVASLGFSLKGLYETIGETRYYGCGADIGTQIELIPLVKMGFVIQDIGTGLKPVKNYDDTKNEYSFAYPTVKIGASVTNRASDMIIAITGIKKLEQERFEANLGFQYNILKNASVYLGLNDSLFSSGFSLRFANMNITYAFSFDKIDFGYNNTLSLTLLI
ncbi:MAG: hypothetical protein V1874_11645 [Spirochaetota bacterium]